MTASAASFSPFNNPHHLSNLSEYWDSWDQGYPSSSVCATSTYNNLQHEFALDPTLHTSAYSSSNAFVNPDYLQAQPQSQPFPARSTGTSISASPVSSHGIDNDDSPGYGPAAKNKRRRSSKYTAEHAATQRAEQYDTLCQEPQRKSIAEPVRRERNRTAAAKCRAKSKAAEEILKDKQRIERERNQILRAAFDDLSNEVLALKHELLNHSACNHPMIDGYLKRSADQISRGMSLSSTSSQASPIIRE